MHGQTNRVGLIGVYDDSETGGIQTHMVRLTEGLKQRGIAVENWYHKSDGWRRLVGLYRRCDVIHLNMSNPAVLFAMAVAARLLNKRRTVVTIHGDAGHQRGIQRWFLRLALKTANFTLVLNDGSRDWAATFLPPHKLRKVTAFLPPLARELKPDGADEALAAKLAGLRDDYAGVFMTYAFNYELNVEGHDLYGIDELVRLFAGLPDLFLLIVDPTAANHNRRDARPAAANVEYVTQRVNTLFLMESLDGYVRNTMTDGDSVALREALHLGVPCFASTATSRPRGAVVYPQHDLAALERRLRETLARRCGEVEADPDPSVIDYYEHLFDGRDSALFGAVACA